MPHADAFTLSVDICGPFRPGHERLKKAKYFMVGVFSIPVRKVEGEVATLPLALEEMKAGVKPEEEVEEKELQPAIEEEEVVRQEGDPRLLEEWERLEVESQEVEIQNYTMVETLTSARSRGEDVPGKNGCSLEVLRLGSQEGA